MFTYIMSSIFALTMITHINHSMHEQPNASSSQTSTELHQSEEQSLSDSATSDQAALTPLILIKKAAIMGAKILIAVAATQQIACFIHKKIMFFHYGVGEPCTDPKIVELFKTIQQDMGIGEDIPLFFIDNDDAEGVHIASLSNRLFDFTVTTVLIGLNKNIVDHDYTNLVHVIAHELAHHKQINGYQDTYQSKSKSILFYLFGSKKDKQQDNWNLEHFADAAATEYQSCTNCLQLLKKRLSLGEEHEKLLAQEPRRSHGYFASSDLTSHIEKTAQAHQQCPAHRDIHKNGPPIHDYISNTQYEMKDFLPQGYDRSNYSLQGYLQNS